VPDIAKDSQVAPFVGEFSDHSSFA